MCPGGNLHTSTQTQKRSRSVQTLTSLFNGTFSISYTLMSLISLYINVFHNGVTVAERMACTGHFHKKKKKLKKAEEIQDDLFSFQQGTLT